MELRTLRYFLEIAREENMTRAAQRLHVTQSTLSKQLRALEEELGRKLFVRHSFSIELTAEGVLLRQRAEDILGMVDKTAEEFQALDGELGGDVFIGCAESDAMKRVADILADLQREHPAIRFHLKSGNTEDLTGDLDKGLLDFAVLAQRADPAKYHALDVPARDLWGAVLPSDHPLAAKAALTVQDLAAEPLILSRQSLRIDYPRFFGEMQDRLRIAATFNLPYNGGVLVRAGLGVMLCFDGLIDTGPGSGLCFRPVTPELWGESTVVWKRYRVFTPAAEALLERLRAAFGGEAGGFLEKPAEM